ncbi:MAG: hypothetical protein LC747_05245 [Acidobacteria bacterium]|nr:hypothetical protein [Acidobacteriota bacterium]
MSAEERERKRYHETREIERLVESFESCALPTAEFDHGAHLTVALWYLAQMPAPEATRRVRAGLHRYTRHNNAQAIYNETITLFWLKLVRHFLDHDNATRPLVESANELIATYINSKLPFEYYSRELIGSPEAKHSWVEPDLKLLEF